MDTIQQLKEELTEERETTRKFLERFPEGKGDYAPHEKSTKMLPLAQHLIQVFAWPAGILSSDTLDLAKGDDRIAQPKASSELLERLDQNYNASITGLDNISETDLEPTWSINHSGRKLAEWTKYGAIRHALNQITHHRAQLGVYYRLLDIPLPNSYGPTADNNSFQK